FPERCLCLALCNRLKPGLLGATFPPRSPPFTQARLGRIALAGWRGPYGSGPASRSRRERLVVWGKDAIP
ncbi:MAG: hypothetical protein ACRDFX_13630, partial [Chloroflexota bacterium]